MPRNIEGESRVEIQHHMAVLRGTVLILSGANASRRRESEGTVIAGAESKLENNGRLTVESAALHPIRFDGIQQAGETGVTASRGPVLSAVKRSY